MWKGFADAYNPQTRQQAPGDEAAEEGASEAGAAAAAEGDANNGRQQRGGKPQKGKGGGGGGGASAPDLRTLRLVTYFLSSTSSSSVELPGGGGGKAQGEEERLVGVSLTRHGAILDPRARVAGALAAQVYTTQIHTYKSTHAVAFLAPPLVNATTIQTHPSHQPPYRAPWGPGKAPVAALAVLHEHVPVHETLRAMDASIVGIVPLPPTTEEDAGQGYHPPGPLVVDAAGGVGGELAGLRVYGPFSASPGSLPPPAPLAPCVGLGILRGVDRKVR